MRIRTGKTRQGQGRRHRTRWKDNEDRQDNGEQDGKTTGSRKKKMTGSRKKKMTRTDKMRRSRRARR